MTEKRRICVVTGSRADFGLLSPLMSTVGADPRMELLIVVTGSHLVPSHGETWREVEAAGFHIAARVEMLLASDSGVSVAKSMGLGVIGLADALDRLCPDLLVLLGDRFETLAAAQAAMALRIPIAHLHGGEATFGAIDEAIRHAITKMAHLHFVAAEPYRRRVVQLGEAPERVFDFGAPGLDAVRASVLVDRPSFETEVGFLLGSPTILVTYHPVTLDLAGPKAGFAALTQALDRFPQALVIITRSNADQSASVIDQLIEAYRDRCPDRVHVVSSLGSRLYLSAVAHADVVVGNSSSGLYEAPLLGTPTVNIGDRQEGRIKAPSVIDCLEEPDAISAAIERALSAEHREHMRGMKLPYGDGDASRKIADMLATVPLEGLLRKRFHDVSG